MLLRRHHWSFLCLRLATHIWEFAFSVCFTRRCNSCKQPDSYWRHGLCGFHTCEPTCVDSEMFFISYQAVPKPDHRS